ncbi:MAG TPA: ATP-binding protein [Jatrophihabitans sp.]
MELDRALNAIEAGATADSLESWTLDFKREGRSRPDAVKAMAEAAACFANARGGYLVIGVKDRAAGPAAFEGTSLNANLLLRRIYELTTPPLTVEVEPVRRLDVTLLVVRVPRSPDVHQVDNRATRRVGTSCEPMSAVQIGALLAERRGEDWSAEDTDRPLSDVSATAVEQARALLRASPDPVRRAYATETDEDLLRILGLTSSHGTLVRAGELLFCEPAGQLAPIVYQYRRTPAGEPIATRPGGPMLLSLLRTLELISARLDTTPVNLPGGQQVQLADLPEPAIREAVANAVIHRDYRLSGSVRVEHAPTRLAISSPGPLVQGVTVSNILTTSSRPRNARLAAAVRTLGLAEEAGVGVDRMYREMVRVGHGPPMFEETAEQVLVMLIGGAPNTHLTRFVATLPQTEADDADAMLILYTLLTKRVVSASQLAPLLQKGDEEVEFVLRRLAAEPAAMLEPTRETARRHHPNYRLREHVITALGAAVAYRRRTTDEYDRKIVELVRESGQINARIVKIALDLEGVSASRVLGDLVERGILAKTSEAQRGPSVTYGPGRGFPSAGRKQSRVKRTSRRATDDPDETG